MTFPIRGESLPAGGGHLQSRLRMIVCSSGGGTIFRRFAMKENIHPNYTDTDINCACGAVYHTRSTRRDLKIGICAACHPFFTGQQKFIDTAGRIEKFGRRYGNMQPAMRKRA